MTHFVYVYMAGPSKWKEIYYSINSIRKNFKGEYKIFVIGDHPRMNGINHIPHVQFKPPMYHKALDVVQKLIIACGSPEIQEDFVFMYDDIILLKKVDRSEYEKARAVDYVPEPDLYNPPDVKGPITEWFKIFLRTMLTLKEDGLPTWNYETHLPRVFNKTILMKVIKRYSMETIPLCVPSMYMNNAHKAPYETLIENPDVKFTVVDPHVYRWLKENGRNKTFLNFNDGGLNEELMKWIKEKI